MQNDLSNFVKLLNVYKAQNGEYPASFSSLASVGGIKIAKGSYDTTGIHGGSGTYLGKYNFLYCLPSDNFNEFSLIAKSRSGKSFQFTKGNVAAFAGVEPANANALCAAAGIVTVAGNTTWSWLYNAGSWNSQVGS